VALSVCSLAGAPGPRLRALLEPFREVADEVVVAADASLGEETLAEYGSVADRLLRMEVVNSERHLAWLHAQCKGDWIFRIDADEVASGALVGALKGLTRNNNIRQYWFPRRWLFGGAKNWLNEPPWWPDYQLRLYRNDCFLRFSGFQHSTATSQPPDMYTELPLYHLDLVVNSYESRELKAARYDALRPGLQAPGGGAMNERYYLPELAPAVRSEPVPPGDLPELERVLGAKPRRRRRFLRRSVRALPVVTAAESARWLDLQPFDRAIHQGKIEPIESSIRMWAGERRVVHFRVTNTGNGVWPWYNPDLHPGHQVRLSYHWRDAEGGLYEEDGERTWLPCRLGSGESTVVPLMVAAPADEGNFILEVDLVQEHWFGCGLGVPVQVFATSSAHENEARA
jgi:hypothetical protein